MNSNIRPSLGGPKPRPVQALLPAVAEEIRARADRSTYATIGAAARLSGIPERRVLQLIEDGRLRTRRSHGETTVNMADADSVAISEGWQEPGAEPRPSRPAPPPSVADLVEQRGRNRIGLAGLVVQHDRQDWIIHASQWGAGGRLELLIIPKDQHPAYSAARRELTAAVQGDSPVITAADLCRIRDELARRFPGVPATVPADRCVMSSTWRDQHPKVRRGKKGVR